MRGVSGFDAPGEGVLDKRDALNRFLAGVERRAFRMAQIATGNREDALEVVQEAMLKLSDRYGDRDPEEWGPLFHRILQSRIHDWYRRQNIRNRFRHLFGRSDEMEEGDPMAAFPDRASEGPMQQLGAEQFRGELESVLGRLPLRQQQAFLLRTWEGLDVAETAAAMGCSPGSVKTHYSRALQALRQGLEEYR